jgi:hypothetical protein
MAKFINMSNYIVRFRVTFLSSVHPETSALAFNTSYVDVLTTGYFSFNKKCIRNRNNIGWHIGSGWLYFPFENPRLKILLA